MATFITTDANGKLKVQVEPNAAETYLPNDTPPDPAEIAVGGIIIIPLSAEKKEKRFPGWIQVRRRCRDDLLRSLSWLDFFIFRKHREASLAEDERQGQQEGQNSSDEELLIFH